MKGPKSSPVWSAKALTKPASFFAFAISSQSMTIAGLNTFLSAKKDPFPSQITRSTTHLSCCFKTLVTRLDFPLPGGPVMVMNVEGYSANHCSTPFSASILSAHAFLPIASSESSVSIAEELRKPNEVGSTNFWRSAVYDVINLNRIAYGGERKGTYF